MKPLLLILKSKKSVVLADQFLYSGMNFIATLFLARFLNTTDFGIYSTVVLTIFLIISLGNAFIIQPFQVASEKFKKSRLYSNFLFFSQLLFIAIIALLTFIIYLFIPVSSYNFTSLIFFSIVIILHDYFRKYFLVKNKLITVLIIDVLIAVGQFFSLLYLFHLHSGNLNTVFSFMGMSYLLAVIFSVLYLKPQLKRVNYWILFFNYHMKEGLWLSLVSFIQWGSGNLFVVSLGVFINIEALGAFRLIQSLFGVLNILFQTFENYVLPNASRIYANSVVHSKKYIQKISLQSAVLIGSVLTVLFIFSDQIIQFAAGEKYAAYGYVVKGMCILYFILFMGYPIRLSIRMLVLNKLFFVGYLLSFIFSILCFNYLLKYLQLNGVIVGLIINQLIMLLFWNYHLRRKGFYLWK